jgi:hypothetical protein
MYFFWPILKRQFEALLGNTIYTCGLLGNMLVNGGRGRANAIFALPLKRLSAAYLAISPDVRNVPFLFENNRLEETVPVVLGGVLSSNTPFLNRRDIRNSFSSIYGNCDQCLLACL